MRVFEDTKYRNTHPIRSETGTTGRVIFTSVLVLITMCLFACANEGDNTSLAENKIIVNNDVLSVADFTDVGFKSSKTYDVSELEQATEVHMGFWTVSDGTTKTFELRIYPSNQIAVEQGVPIADEATGDLYRELKDAQSWSEGERDRWQNWPQGTPIYGDYAVLGNVVLLCEGRSSEASLIHCGELIKRVNGSN